MKRFALFALIAAACMAAAAQVNRPLPPSSVNNARAVDSFVYPVVPSTDQIRGIASSVMYSACGAGQVLSGGACVSTSSFGGVPTVAKLVEAFAGRSVGVFWPNIPSNVSIWIDGTNVCTSATNLGGAFCVSKYGPFSATNGYIVLTVSPLGIVVDRAGYSDSSWGYSTVWDSSQLTMGQAPTTIGSLGQGSSP
jgi:hypothetical protein